MKPKHQGAKGRTRRTVADVQKALEVQRTDPAKFERFPRLQWILATCVTEFNDKWYVVKER